MKVILPSYKVGLFHEFGTYTLVQSVVLGNNDSLLGHKPTQALIIAVIIGANNSRSLPIS